MIGSFRHKGLERFFLEGTTRGIPAQQEKKIRRILFRLAAASVPGDLAQPGYRLHPLKGELAGYWSVWVNANWRIIFRFEDGDAHDVELIDYH